MAHARKVVSCVVCGQEFTASDIVFSGRKGKMCPGGHFNTVHELRTGKLSARRAKAVKEQGAPEDPRVRVAEQIGKGKSRVVDLTMALQCMLDSYEKLVDTTKASPVMNALVVGAFDKYAKLAKRVLTV